MKKIKFLLSLFSASIIASGVITPALFLTSCSSNKSNNYEYNNSTKIFSVNSNFFDWNNIFIAIQQLASKDEFNKVTDIILYLNEIAPKLFNYDMKFNVSKITFSDNLLVIPISNVNEVETIEVKFDNINFSDLDIPTSNIYSIQANTVFFNMTIKDISMLDGKQLLSLINQNSYSNIPIDTYIYNSYKIVNDQYVKFYIFLPNFKVPVGILNIYMSELSVPIISPVDQIKELGIANDWNKIVNWQTSTIDTSQYKYIENTLDTNLFSSEDIISTYYTAENSNIVKKAFEDNLYNNLGPKFNIIDDYYYCIKNLISNIVNSWTGVNLLDLNVYCGNNINFENNKINGNLVLQFENTSSVPQKINKDNFYFNLDIPEIEIPVNGIICLVVNFENSNIYPSLSIKSSIEKTAYLTTSFDNISIELFSNNISCYNLEINSEKYMFMPNSYSQSTIIKNVYPGTNILENTINFEKSIENLSDSSLENINLNYIENKITKFKIILKSIQNIMLYVSQNPNIYDFLTNINNDLYNLIYALTDNKYISKIIGNLFTNQNVSTFLYFNLDNIINVINDLIPESDAKTGLLGMLYDIKKSNNSLEQMKVWVSNLVSLKPMLEKVLSSQLGWLLQIIGPLLENISLDPNIFDCLLTMLPDILKTLSIQEGTIGNIGVALLNFFSKLIIFANEYDPDCVDNPITENNYKEIHVLDFIVNEFTEGNDNSLFDILMLVLGNNSTIKTIVKIVNAINFKMNCKIRISQKNALLQTYNYEQMNLYDVIKWIIKAFFLEVELENGTTTDLYTAISDNLQYTYNNENFQFDKNNNVINQSCNWEFSLKQQIKINTLPIAALISKENINLDLSSLDLPQIVSTLINTIINNAIPVNLVISPKNIVNASFDVSNSPLFPSVSSTGILNWNYAINNTMNIDMSYILSDSNIRTSTQEKCYGSSYALLKTLLPTLVSTKVVTNKIEWMSTDLSNFIIIENYNNSSYISELYVNQLVNDDELINNFTNWINDSSNYVLNGNKYEINYDSLDLFLKNNFKFSNEFNNDNFANYYATITSANYKLVNQTNSYTLNIVFPCPVLIIKPDNSCSLSNNYTLLINI